ncbi:unnamed protein product [Peniophora sp. CBMAI 1063]|nr:unnamed protein product [Peniophora sp. CBMAI 1063]
MTGSYVALDVLASDKAGGNSTPPPPDKNFPTTSTIRVDDRHPRDPHQRASRIHRLLCLPMALHVAVLVIHIVLCVVWATHVGLSMQVPLTKASYTQTWLNLISHLVMLAFSTAIVALMQRIVTNSVLSTLPQPLTSVSDRLTAWTGLGSSLLNVYHNLNFEVTLRNSIFIALYFSVLSGLNISSSLLFNVPPANETNTIPDISLEGGTPSIVNAAVYLGSRCSSDGSPLDVPSLIYDWYRAGLSVEALNGRDSINFPGLSGNRIFDTVGVYSGSNASVNAGYTDFHVQCGGVPEVSISATNLGLSNSTSYSPYFANASLGSSATQIAGNDTYRVLLSINYTLGTTPMQLYDTLSLPVGLGAYVAGRLWQPSNILMRVPHSDVVQGIGRNLILYNIYNDTGPAYENEAAILDSQGSKGSPWAFEVANANDAPTSGLRVQVIGCSLSTSTGRTSINPSTNQLLGGQDSGKASNSTWANWKPDLTRENALEDTWASMFLPNIGSPGIWDSSLVPVSETAQWSCLSMLSQSGSNSTASTWSAEQLEDMYKKCHAPTIIEDYLTNRVFSRSQGEENTATLRNLESALEGATAMAMQSAARSDTLTITCPQSGSASDALSDVGARQTVVGGSVTNADLVQQELVGRVTFNAVALIAGTVLSAILVSLGAYVLLMEDTAHTTDTAPINDAGLLSLMSLDNSAVAARLSSRGMNSAFTRRRAGRFLVEIVDGRLVPVEEQV